MAGEREISKHVSEELCNPKIAACYCDILNRMRNGFYETVDIVVQKHARAGDYNLEDAWCFGQVHTLICTGKIVRADIFVGSEPRADRDIEYNNSIVSSLYGGFSGEFWGGAWGTDGYIKVNSPIEFGSVAFDGEVERISSIIVSDWDFPLEVGYVNGATTITRLIEQRSIARWPYGDEWIHLLRLIDDDIFSVKLSIERSKNAQ